MAGRWWDVLELELGAGGGACNGDVGNANTDSGGRNVTVVDGGMLAEEMPKALVSATLVWLCHRPWLNAIA